MQNFLLHTAPDLTACCLAAAEWIERAVHAAVRERGRFVWVLSGGQTPALLYQLLAQPPFSARLPWSAIHVFWGDERFVPPDHPDSNQGMAERFLLSRVPLPRTNIHAINTRLGSPQQAAEAYERELRACFSQLDGGFDLTLLGLGADGHTASLFPGSAALVDSSHWVCAVPVPAGVQPAVARISLTFPALARSQCIAFLVAGADKRPALEKLLSDNPSGSDPIPAAQVTARGTIHLFVETKLLPAGAVRGA